jgi:peroxiredoxin
VETLERFECWQESLKLAESHYLEPTDQLSQQVVRFKAIARAHFGLGGKDGLVAVRDEIAPRLAEAEEKKKKQSEEAKEKAKKEKKNKKDTDKMVKDAVKAVDGDIKQLRPLQEEIAVYLELLDGGKLDADKAKKIKRSKSILALLHLEYGEAGRAAELAAEAVKENQKRTVPLAVQVHVLEQSGKKDEAAEAFAKLLEISSHLQLDAAPFSRIAPVAKRLGKAEDWRSDKPWRGEDFGQDKPEDLSHLGPLAYESPRAPDFDLIAEDGKKVSLSSFSGKPVLLIFYLGHNCEHCVQQLNAFAPMAGDFKSAGISLAAIGPEPLVELAKAHELCAGDEKHFPFPLYSDLSTKAFKAYRSYDDFEDLPLHGTFLIDTEGRLRWMDVGPEPFQKPDFLLKEAKRLLGM